MAVYNINDKRVVKFTEAGKFTVVTAKVSADTFHNIRDEFMDDVSTVSGNTRSMKEGIKGWIVQDFKRKGNAMVKIPCTAEKDTDGYPIRKSKTPCVGCALQSAAFDKIRRRYMDEKQSEIDDLKQLLSLSESKKDEKGVKAYNKKIQDKMGEMKKMDKETLQSMPIDNQVDFKMLLWFEGEERLATHYGKKKQLTTLAKALNIDIEKVGAAKVCSDDMLVGAKMEVTLVPATAGKTEYLAWSEAKVLSMVDRSTIPQEDWKLEYQQKSEIDKEYAYHFRAAVRFMSGSNDPSEEVEMDMNLMSSDEDVDMMIEKFISDLITSGRTDPLKNMALREIGDDWGPVREILKKYCLRELSEEEIMTYTVAGKPRPKYMFVIPPMQLN